MRKVEHGAYFQPANLELVKIISFFIEFTNLKKTLIAPAVCIGIDGCGLSASYET